MIRNKKLPFWLLFPLTIQIFYMIYLFQKNGQILVVLLGMSVFIIFGLVYHYKGYVKELELLQAEALKSGDDLKAQHEMAKYLFRTILLFLLFSVLLSILFKINIRTTSSFVILSGALGTLFAKGINDMKEKKEK